jgi:hypothetical protein
MRSIFRGAIAAVFLSSTSATALADPVSVPERLMEDLQTDLALTDYQAAGIVGNLARETGNFRFLQELNPLVRGSRGGIGYAQWTGPRHDAFLDYADGRDLMGYEVNYGFLIEELEGPYADVLARLYETSDAGEASGLFMRGYLAPHPKYRHLAERVTFAQAYLEGDFSGAGCATVHITYPVGETLALQDCPRNLSELQPQTRPHDLMDNYPGVEVPTPPITVLPRSVEVRDPFLTVSMSGPEPG